MKGWIMKGWIITMLLGSLSRIPEFFYYIQIYWEYRICEIPLLGTVKEQIKRDRRIERQGGLLHL